MRQKTVIFCAAAVFVFCAAAGAVLAHGNATGIVAERMHGMMLMARSIKSLSAMFDTGNFDPATVNEAAATIERHAGETMISLFPEGSTEAPSEAMPEIWKNWQEFSQLALKLRALAGDLAKSTDATDENAVRSTSQQAAPVSGVGESSDMWAALDEHVLLGLETKPRAEVVSAQTVQPTTASAGNVFVEITKTCAGCHAQFRRSK